MELDTSSLLLLLASLTFLAMLLKLSGWSRAKSKQNSNLPSGPRRLPLLGNMHNFTSSEPPYRTLTALAANHGPMMRLQLGEVTIIVISSPDAAREVLKTHDMNFANRPMFLAVQSLTYNYADIGFAPYGEYWRQLRKICTLELLSVRRTQSIRPIREDEFSGLCRWIASNAGSTINLTEGVESRTCDIFMLASIGQKMSEQKTLIPAIKEAVDIVSGFELADFFPSFRFLRLISRLRRRAAVLHKTMDRIIGKVIDDHRVCDPASKKREDLLDVLLKFNDPNHQPYLTTDNIKAVILDMFTAGIETSSTIIDWAMAELMRNPRVLKKAQDEVREVFKDKGFVDESDFDKLEYLKLILKETLRLHSPVPLLLPRESREPCEIQGYSIPAKTRVMINAWAMGRNPKYWDDPESFIPERYYEHPVDYRGDNFEYLPFGAGRRTCPGMSFGLATAELALAMLVFHFDWVLPDGMKPEDVDMTDNIGTTARRAASLHVIPIVKNPLQVK